MGDEKTTSKMSLEDKLNAAVGVAAIGGVLEGAHITGATNHIYNALRTSPGVKHFIEGASASTLVGGGSVALGYGAKKLMKKLARKWKIEEGANAAETAAGIGAGFSALEIMFKLAPEFVRGAFYDTGSYGHWFEHMFRDYIPAGIAFAGIVCASALAYGGIRKLFK